ncbi:hypothetical protein KM043_000172 [Ampulex compressa]|nr:hypothetical protein KM043_000172 [Ampulex compressa]
MIQLSRSGLVRHGLSKDMHALVSITVGTILSIPGPSVSIPSANEAYRTGVPKKCCTVGYAFNEDLECVKIPAQDSVEARALASQALPEILAVIVPAHPSACAEGATPRRLEDVPRRADGTIFLPIEFCFEKITNGTRVLVGCPNGTRPSAAAEATTARARSRADQESKHEDYRGESKRFFVVPRDLGTVVFWGAQTYMSTNIAHVIMCVVVVVTYLSVPELGKGLYNRSVLRHNVCLLALGCILSFLGYCHLCDCPVEDDLVSFLWLLLQYFTITTVFWLNVICFDMTLSITRFRWMLGSGRRSDREENRRLLLYGIFAWGGALLPTVCAAFFEFCPGVPTNFPLKPNYYRYRLGPNPVVNIYFFAVPMLTLFCNNLLFIFTTYRILRMQQSTEMATKSHTNVLRKKYFLFLRLYLLMGAPWFFGSLFACWNKLVTLKICRLIQPILWLLMLVARKDFRYKLTRALRPGLRAREATEKNDANAVGNRTVTKQFCAEIPTRKTSDDASMDNGVNPTECC